MHLGSVLLAAGCLFGIGCPGTGRLSGDDDAPPGPDQEDAGARSEADPSPEAPRGSDRPARDPDLDDDGLDDRIELALGTDAAQEDSDGDGWLDGVERRAGTDPLDPTATPPGDARQIVLDPDTPRTVTLPFVARVSRGNVFFLVDGTGSMAAVIDAPASVKDDGLDDAGRSRWIVRGKAADGAAMGPRGTNPSSCGPPSPGMPRRFEARWRRFAPGAAETSRRPSSRPSGR